MNVYIYRANLYCKDCVEAIKRELTEAGLAPVDDSDESTYDSDDFPKGPYPNGGAMADTRNRVDLAVKLCQLAQQHDRSINIEAIIEIIADGVEANDICDSPTFVQHVTNKLAGDYRET